MRARPSGGRAVSAPCGVHTPSRARRCNRWRGNQEDCHTPAGRLPHSRPEARPPTLARRVRLGKHRACLRREPEHMTPPPAAGRSADLLAAVGRGFFFPRRRSHLKGVGSHTTPDPRLTSTDSRGVGSRHFTTPRSPPSSTLVGSRALVLLGPAACEAAYNSFSAEVDGEISQEREREMKRVRKSSG